MEPYLPILSRMLHRGGGNIRTNVEFRGQRRNGDIFLANVWLSTYDTSDGPGLAAVVWDSSENLRDREGAGLDSMMATSRVLVGALSHEIRNLASAAASAHAALAAAPRPRPHAGENYQALGTLIRGLEKIASAGLQMSSGRERAVAGSGTVLDETRIVIEPALREAGHYATLGSAGAAAGGAGRSSQPAAGVPQPGPQQPAGAGAMREARSCASRPKWKTIWRSCASTIPGPAWRIPKNFSGRFSRAASHTGLGLYITRAILRSHGGGLRYEPQTRGSCFTVELWPVENTSEG